jgi:hypothetical protein
LNHLRRAKGGADIATPKLLLADFELLARRVFRKSGYRFCNRNTRQIISDAFSKR